MSEMTKTTFGGDSRLKKSDTNSAAVRSGRDESENAVRTQTDGTMLSLEERRRLLRSEWQNDVLPVPPKIPGWHCCWLSTTNSTDPIYKRIQRGYVPVRAEEVPGFQSQGTAAQGEFVGCVSCNEMLLFKIEEELYQDVMRYFHFERPNEEEDIVRANAKENLSGRDNTGRDLGQTEGFFAEPERPREDGRLKQY